MWLSDVAVRRPVLATVVNALLLVFGLFALSKLAVREYPNIDPPVVSVQTSYTGASAAVVESKITQVLEDQVAGLEGVRSITSSSRDGRSTLTIEFNLSRDIDAAASDVRDRVARAQRDLPAEADPPQITKADADASPIIWFVLDSTTLSPLELTAWAEQHLSDRFSALDGVSAVRIGGERRPAMRIWLDRQALAARNLTVDDVEKALNAQNVERPAGRLESRDREFTLRTARQFVTADDFAKLVVARGGNGYPVKLGDVARVEVAPADLRTLFRADGRPAVGLGLVKQSTANTLAVARAAKAEAARISATLPAGMTLRVNTDYSLFIEAALHEVLVTLGIAALLVVIVIFLFLGDWRATLIPAVTVPISLVASFIFLHAFGFSINILTLLALVLAIGLVVDDTIVVVENIHRRLQAGETPLVASFRGVREVGFAVVATTAVLVTVFVPLAFLEGTVGRLFSEFALALAASVFCSAIVALTLAPVLCSYLFRAGHRADRLAQAVDRTMAAGARRYTGFLGRFVDRPWSSVLAMAVLLAGAALLFRVVPHEFTPPEDRGQFVVQVTGPEGASYDYMTRYLQAIEDRLQAHGVHAGTGAGHEIDRYVLRIPGGGGNASDAVNTGMAMVSLVDWSRRDRSTAQVADALGREFTTLPGVRALAAQRSGFGGGFGQPLQLVLQGNDYATLAAWADRLQQRIAAENPRIVRVDTDFRETKPTLDLALDLQRAADLGVDIDTVARTLETMLAGRRVTTWLQNGEEYDVMLQAGAAQRVSADDIGGIYVRSATSGRLVALGNLLTTRETAGAPSWNRYNRLRAITLTGGMAPGYTLGEAVRYLQRAAAETAPPEGQIAWKGDSRELLESTGALYLTFAVALLVVFLVLAAQFESFLQPAVIMTTVPLAVFGALAALAATGHTLNIYSQIGIVMLVGLAAKNGILIVEFANQRRDAGLAFRDALLDAARTRLRPILMTSIATAAGAVPLILAGGAGSEARSALGLVVFCGVLFSTLVTLVVVPAFYALLCRRGGTPRSRGRELERQEAP